MTDLERAVEKALAKLDAVSSDVPIKYTVALHKFRNEVRSALAAQKAPAKPVTRGEREAIAEAVDHIRHACRTGSGDTLVPGRIPRDRCATCDQIIDTIARIRRGEFACQHSRGQLAAIVSLDGEMILLCFDCMTVTQRHYCEGVEPAADPPAPEAGARHCGGCTGFLPVEYPDVAEADIRKIARGPDCAFSAPEPKRTPCPGIEVKP